MHDIAGPEFPAQLTRVSVQRIEISVAAAEVNCAVHHCGTGKKDVERIGKGLVFRLPTMQAFRFETALPFRGKFPFHRTALRVERVEFSVVAADVNRAVVDRRSARHRPTRGGLPNLLPALRIHRIDIPVVTSEVDDLVLYHRRTDDTRSGREFPLHAMKLARRRSGIYAGVRGVAAEHRLRFCRTRQGEEQKKKR